MATTSSVLSALPTSTFAYFSTASPTSSDILITTSLATQASATPTFIPASALFSANNGKAQQQEGISLETFLASLAVAAIIFGVEVLLFVLLRKKLKRVYEPRTYLVPDKRRTPAPATGLLNFFAPVFETATSDFIAKSGLDAYFFLRYLLMLLKVFVVVALAILPILLPINYLGGKSGDQVHGLDRLAWSNVAPSETRRYWAHLVMALVLIIVFCYMFYSEMRKYVRLRQAYLTSPQHRLRASATTVLVSGIPAHLLMVQKLVELYDVFPGGIRNVWINRDYEKLQEKVEERDDFAKKLEKAETELIAMCTKKHLRRLAKSAKKDPKAAAAREKAEGASEDHAVGPGMSSGNPHQIPEHIRDPRSETPHKRRMRLDAVKAINPLPAVSGVFSGVGQGLKGGVKKIACMMTDNEHFDREVSGRSLQQRPTLETRQTSRSSRNSITMRGSTLVGEDGQYIVLHETTTHDRSHPEESTDSHPGSVAVKKRSAWNKKVHRRVEEDETPLSAPSPTSPTQAAHPERVNTIKKVVYPKAYDELYENDQGGEPVWKKYVSEKDRPTMRLPLFKWMIPLPLIGKKVDTIYYCRKEVARLNLEIEMDQEIPENYPQMNSAFVQFNQQVAAHMACQCVSYHVPQYMAPRHIEVSPNDVVWGNMKMQWWERYCRHALILLATAGLVIGWAFPVAAVGLISQINYLSDTFKWLEWLKNLPDSALGLISGVLPPLLLGILMALLPIILRLFARIQGCHTGMAIEKTVQGMYFAFLFIQVFLVVSISSGITTVVEEISKEPFKTPQILATNLPKASNFFFSYMLLQAFSVSGAALLQIATLLINFVVSPIMDTTARDKFQRATNLQEIKWGTFFPIYTNLACIGIVYSVISPLILIFNIITFSLFWVVYRYNLLFVVNFRFDTGGLLFPRAIDQLFTGIYVMEVCLIGLFFLVRDSQNNVACFPQAIIMTIATILTAVFQSTLQRAFRPLLCYLPISLEDDAVLRDEQFAKEQDAQRRKLIIPEERPGDDLNILLERRELGQASGGIEMDNFTHQGQAQQLPRSPKDVINRPELALFQDIADEIEDLTPEERDHLVGRAFQHPAIRAKRPVIWMPRDALGVSDDEIERTKRFSNKIWISNAYAGLDKKGRVVYGKSPPDLDMRDLVEL